MKTPEVTGDHVYKAAKELDAARTHLEASKEAAQEARRVETNAQNSYDAKVKEFKEVLKKYLPREFQPLHSIPEGH